MNIPLCVLAVAFTVGLPAWVMLKHPDVDTTDAHAVTARVREHAAATHDLHHGAARSLNPSAS